jgi:hypothetical protein
MPELDDPIRLLQEIPIDGRRLAAVRRRVLERVGTRRFGPGRWLLAGAVAAGVFAAFAWTSVRTGPESLVAAWSAPKPPDWALSPTPDRRVAAPAASVAEPPAQATRQVPADPNPAAIKVLAVQAAPQEGEPETALLGIPTSNPDVVLYWLVDSGGD